MVKVSVIGAGINGIACALRIKETYPNFEVVVLSEEFSPDTTGDGSGGLWYPYCCGNTPGYLLGKWGGETYKFLHSCWLEGGYNVTIGPVYSLSKEHNKETMAWASTVFGFRYLEPRQLEYLSRLYSEDYASGHMFTTFIVHTTSMLSYLYSRFARAGGELKRAKVTSLRDPVLGDYDVVVNCTGLGARDLVSDSGVFPVRGQVIRVDAPWQNDTVLDKSSGHYIIPNAETVVLGGTQQEHDFNTGTDPNDTEFILNGCCSRIPTMKAAKVVKHWTGLRPGRDQVRLELEIVDGRLAIHNYGHGGSGVTLFWGCASNVLDLLQANLNQIDRPVKSKL
ncbi:D-amino-acid oxidase [Cydia splendana]|uniref:D-amino-acid oxidase n=1 Tax=Cydia splendana TaxID=1100963 RepID=UPI0021374289